MSADSKLPVAVLETEIKHINEKLDKIGHDIEDWRDSFATVSTHEIRLQKLEDFQKEVNLRIKTEDAIAQSRAKTFNFLTSARMWRLLAMGAFAGALIIGGLGYERAANKSSTADIKRIYEYKAQNHELRQQLKFYKQKNQKVD